MGKIVPVIYTDAEDYSLKDAIKNYWFQNILDSSNMEEYENYQIEQRRARDNNIAKATKALGIHGKTDTCIMGPSVSGRMVIAFEFE